MFFTVQYALYLHRYIKEWRKNPKWSLSCCLALVLPLTELQSEIRGLTGKNVLTQQLQTGKIGMPSVSSTLKESGLVSFELKEQETKPNPKGRRRGKVVSTLRRETEDNVIGQESLTVRGDARERKRATFDLKDQEYNPTPRAERCNREAERQRENNEENIIGQQSFTVHVDVHQPRRVKTHHKKQAVKPSTEEGKSDEMVTTLSERNEEYLGCQESLAIDIDEGGRRAHGLAEQEANQSPEEGKSGAEPSDAEETREVEEPRDAEETREVEDTWL